MSDPMREEFEAWARPRPHRFAHPFIRFESGDGTDSYSLDRVEDMWQSWQAAMSHKTVVTDSMVEAGCRAWQMHLLPESHDGWNGLSEEYKSVARGTMRIALTAALTVEGE